MTLSALALLLAACHGAPEKQADKMRQTQHSWEETARLTAELRQRNAVPAIYTRQVLDAAGEELDKLRRSARKLSP